MISEVQLSNFTAGEGSPRMKGRTDYAKYFNMLDTEENMVTMPQGGATKRPGTLLGALTKDQQAALFAVRDIGFVFSSVQAYTLEFGGGYIRVYMEEALVVNQLQVTGAANNGADVIRLTLAGGLDPQPTAGLYSGNTMTVAGVVGVPANGTWQITVVDGTHVDLNGSVFDGAYSSSGTTTTPVEIPTPYATADLAALSHIQSDDQLFLTCGTGGAHGTGYTPMVLTRSSHTAWTLTAFQTLDGPYLSQNLTAQTVLTPSGMFGTPISGTANNGAGLVRLTVGTTTGLASGMQVAVSLLNGTVEANGVWTMTLVDGTHVDLRGSVFENAYASSDATLWAIIAPITLTANQAAGINNGAGFLTSDIGRQIRYQSTDGRQTLWFAGTIATVPSSLAVTVNVTPLTRTSAATLVGTVPSSIWALGAWSDTLGWPYHVNFWQERLVFYGNANQPNAVDQSNTGAFNLFGFSNPDGTVVASNAVHYVITDGDPQGDSEVDQIRWACLAGSAQALQLAIGLSGSEDIMQAATPQQPLGPANVQVYQETAFGSAANVTPIRIVKALIFADRSGRKLLEWSFYWQVNGYDAIDKTEYCEHITAGPAGSDPASWGIRWLAYQQSPYKIIWAGLNNGQLISFTYDKNENIWAGERHRLGGQYYGAAPIVESGCVIPAPDGTYDELWLVVLRTVAGVATRTHEVMDRFFYNGAQDDACFLDCAVKSLRNRPNAVLTPPALSGTSPAFGTAIQTQPPGFVGSGNFTASAGIFTPGETGQILRINGGKVLVTATPAANTVTGQVLVPLLSLAPAAAGAWSFDNPQSSFGGLSYANGETIGVWADGGDQGTQTCVGGTVHLAVPASYAIAGFPYVPLIVTMPAEPLRQAQFALSGKVKKVERLYLRFYESAEFYYGRRQTDELTGIVDDRLSESELRQGFHSPALPTPLFTGIKRLDPLGGYDREGQVIVAQQVAGPLTVLSLNATVDTGDMPAGA